MPDRPGTPRLLVPVSALLLIFLVISGIRPYDRLTWFMEVLPVMIALPVMWATRRSYPLTAILYVAILVHGTVLILGGAYTYARVPLGFQIADWFGLTRNPYDKIGHFLQGFVPALVAREILLRGEYTRGRRMLPFLVVCVALAISAAYELVEWAAAVAMGQGAEEFLGTQGYVWDTQSDMFCALLGAVAALLLLSRLQDRQIAELLSPDPGEDGPADRPHPAVPNVIPAAPNVIPAAPTVVPAAPTVVPAISNVIPAKAGIQDKRP
jgi:putative membrane protein